MSIEYLTVYVRYPDGAESIHRLPAWEIEEFMSGARQAGAWVSVVRELRRRCARPSFVSRRAAA